jgi:hypothetical protein
VVELLRHCASSDMRERKIVMQCSFTTRLLRDGGRSVGRRRTKTPELAANQNLAILLRLSDSLLAGWLPVYMYLLAHKDLVTAEFKPTRPNTSLSQVTADVRRKMPQSGRHALRRSTQSKSWLSTTTITDSLVPGPSPIDRMNSLNLPIAEK